MSKHQYTENTSDSATFLQEERREHTALIRLCGNFFDSIRNLGHRDALLNAFDALCHDSSVKVIILSAGFCGTTTDDYIRFFREQRGRMEKQDAHRFCNTINQILLEMVRAPKLVVHACSGNLPAFFLGMSMASDYGVAGEHSVFHNSFLDVGALPKGGLPYFISRRARSSAVYDLLLDEQTIPARQAEKLGLLHRSVPEGQEEEAAFAHAATFGRVPLRTITGTKRLTNWCIRDLEEYLSYENKQILKTLDVPE